VEKAENRHVAEGLIEDYMQAVVKNTEHHKIVILPE